MSMFKGTDKDATSSLSNTDRARENPASAPPSLTPVATVREAIQTHPKPALPAGPAVSVISKALKISGQLESTEDIQIDGEVDGDVHGTSVTVGPSAKVKGSVYAETVELSGKIDGKIEAKEGEDTTTRMDMVVPRGKPPNVTRVQLNHQVINAPRPTVGLADFDTSAAELP